MTAVSLFDLLARSDGTGSAALNRLAPFADRLVEAALADHDRLRRDEQAVLAARAGDHDDGLDLDLLRSLWDLYSDWARDAEQVLARVRTVVSNGHGDLARLEDAYGTVRARLSVTPERLMQGRQQVSEGNAVPAGELRDELRARIRA